MAKDAGFFESFRIADDVLRQGVQGISDIITIPGVINRDFADVKTTMAGMGYSVMGTAVRSGPDRAREAAMAAMASPLLEAGAIDGARGILINITGSSSLKLNEVNEASTLIQNAAHEDANIIFGAVLDEKMGEDVKITVIATGFRDEMPQRRNRMLAESTLPTRSEPPLPRIEQRPATARFASETPAPTGKDSREAADTDDSPAPQPQVLRETTPRESEQPRIYMEPGFESSIATATMEAAQERVSSTEARQELLPVPASVFDDDFFRKPNEELRATGLQSAWPESKVSAFTGQATESMPATDELDIPAFLRRSH